MSNGSTDILILDDNVDISTMMKSILQYGGFTVTICNEKEQLYKALDRFTPRLIMMDMLLGNTDGRQLCRILKNDSATSAIPVLMISAHPDAERTCKEAGADGFLEKPFEIEELLTSARTLMTPAN